MPVREVAQDPLIPPSGPDTLHSFLKNTPMLDTELLFRFEDGELDFEETITLFEQILESKAYTWLQGYYGRTLQDLINQGYINV